MLDYWVPSSGTSVLAQPMRGIRRGRRLKKGRLRWKDAGQETGREQLQGDRTGWGGNGVSRQSGIGTTPWTIR